MKKLEKLYEGNMRKKYLLFAIPLVLSGILSQSYNFINSVMIGKYIGSEAFAATAVTAQLLEMLNSIFFGYLTGVGIYVSVLFGKNDYKKMLSVIKLNFLFSSFFAIAVSLLCNIFCSRIFDILNVSDDIYKNAELYFRTYAAGYLFFQFNWGFTYISNGMGLTKMPLTASVVIGILNVALNYFFLVIMNKGIEFSALATVIATFFATVFYFIIYIRLFKKLGIKFSEKTNDKPDLKTSFEYGIPTMIQQMIMYTCTALVSPLANTCATAALSGYAIANRAQSLLLSIYQNSSKANTTFVAQAMGSGKIEKIRQGMKIGIVQGLSFFGISMGAFMLFAKEFTALFLDPVTDAESFTVSVNIIRFLLPFLLFNVFNNLFHGLLRAIGSNKLMMISTAVYAVSFVIYAYIFFAVLPYEIRIYGVHIALAAAYITEVIFATVIFFTGKWKSPEYKKLEKNL